jgi:tetratricopeptide (TPR) repeat protein
MTDKVTDSNEKDGQTWLRRTLSDLLKRGKRGDVIAAYVGEDARDVVIGKNIIKIGTLVIPTVPVLAILFVVVSALIFVAVNFLGPTKMDARFNVVVAEVGEMDAEGQMHRSEDGQLLSKWIFDELVTANEKYEDSGVEIWHDSLSLLEKRVKLGMVSGKTPEARAEAASKLASKIDADVVIYGHLTPHESPAEFVLEFYVKPRVRGEANVTIGRYQLGEPINRAGALFWLLLGLRDDLLGRPEEALAVFQQAEEELTSWKEQGEGKEILYSFMGRALLFLKRDVEAEEALQKALESNPRYARAHIVLGGVYFLRAQNLLLAAEQPLEPKELEKVTKNLEQATNSYQKGLELAQESHEPLIEVIARLALAIHYYRQGDTYFVLGDDAEANRFFDLAVEETALVLDPLGDAGQHRLLAQAYLNLGAAYTRQAEILREQGDLAGSRTLFEKARAAYVGCMDQGKGAPHDQILKEMIIMDLCQPYDKDVEQALLTLEGGQD